MYGLQVDSEVPLWREVERTRQSETSFAWPDTNSERLDCDMLSVETGLI